MALFNSMIRLQMQLFLLMLCGYAVRKLKVITAEQQKGLSSLLINVILPANIIASFTGGIEMSSELLHNAVTAVIISAAVQTASYVLGPLLFGRFDKARSAVMRYGMIVSNSSFIGIPVVETIYGSIGTMYTSVYQIPIRLTMWTLGLALYAGESGSLKQKIIKMLTHPCIVAVGIGFVILVTGVKLPSAVTGTLSSLGRCVSALSMLIIGGILSEIHAGKLADRAILYFTLIRLVIFPGIVLAILKFMPVDPMILAISVIMTAMPAGSTTAILAQQYGYDAEYAAKVILVSTLASVITIPVLCLFL